MTKFWIIIGSIVFSLVVATVTTLVLIGKKTIKVDFEFAKIQKISIYDNSLISQNIAEGSIKYYEIQDELNKSMTIKKFSTMGKNLSVNTSVRILPDKKYSNTILTENKCVVLEFENEQTQIARFGNDTKKITYKKLLITLDGSNEICDHVVYYAGSTGDFLDQPMVIAFNEETLQKLFD